MDAAREKEVIMERSNYQVVTAPVTEIPSFAESGSEKTRPESYHTPQLFIIGKAVDLLQGGYGGYWDCVGGQSQNGGC